MNTITINTINPESNDLVSAVTYTEVEVKDLVKKAQELSEAYRQLTVSNNLVREIRNNIHGFFSEGEWSCGEQTVSRSDLNDLFNRCGIRNIQAKYSATVTVTLTVTDFEADSEDDLEYDIQNDLDISIGNGEVDIDGVEVCNVEEA